MQPRRRSDLGALVLLAVGAATAAGAAAAILSWGLQSGWNPRFTGAAVAFATFVAIGDLLEIPLDRRSVFSLGLAPGLAYGLLRHCPGLASNGCTFPALGEVALTFVAGSTAALAWRMIRRREHRAQVVAARLLVVLTSAGVYRLVVSAVSDVGAFAPSHLSLPGLAAVLVAAPSLDIGLQSLLGILDEPRPIRQIARDEVRATTPLLLSTVSVAALMALAYPVLKGWTLPLFLAPVAATQYSFKQVASIRINYLQTVRALAKVPEMAGYTPRDHSARVAQLAVQIAQEFGVPAPEVRDIEYAALLHDIGRISLPDPEEARTTSNLQLALVGAAIIEETGHLASVARMVRDQHEPYRRRGENVNRALAVGARIIRVASAYDDLTEPPGPGRTPWDALERLHLGMAYDYDPAVIQALTRVLERRGLI